MTEKRLIVDEDYNLVDTVTGEWLDDNQVFDLANDLYEEVMNLRKEITTFKLVVGEIIKDMQKYVDDDQLVYINQSYVDWIKENVDTTLYSQKGDVE